MLLLNLTGNKEEAKRVFANKKKKKILSERERGETEGDSYNRIKEESIYRQKMAREIQLDRLILLLEESLKDFMDVKSDLVMMPWKDQFNGVRENLLLFGSFLQSTFGGNTSTATGSGDKQITILIQNISLLINYLHSDFEQIDGEEVKALLLSTQVVAFKVAYYSLLSRYGEFRWWKMYSEGKDRVDSLMRVWILRALVMSLKGFSRTILIDEFLTGYEDCTQYKLSELVKDLMKDQFETLHQGLCSLLPLLVRHCAEPSDNSAEPSDNKICFQSLFLSNVSSVFCSCFTNRMGSDMDTTELTTELSGLLEKLDLIKVETIGFLYSVIFNRIGQESPKIHQPRYFNVLLWNWKEYMDCESVAITDRKDKFRMIHENLVLFGSFMEKVTSNTSGDDESQNLCNRIMNAGCMAEYLLNSFAVEPCPVWCTSLWISELTENFEPVKAAVMEVNEKKGKDKEINGASQDPSQVSSQALVVPTTDVVVGFEVEMKLIRERLAGHLKKLDVISIVGMPGLGKTTLARKVFDDSFTVNYFDFRAWCCVSQEYNRKKLFLTILGQIIQLTDLISRKNEADLSVMVHQELKGRRYLIVLDDVWGIDAFMDLKRFFPDDTIGSRIILTSRNNLFGSQAKCYSDPIEPGMLTDRESWDLLERKVYGEGKCPLELCQIGKEIAQKCRGLPLAVVVVGGLLAKSTQKRDFWEQVAGNLSSYLAHDSQSQFMAALELSYKFLPDCLKPLFLYLGAFPEDKEIPMDKLIWLWIAEGFVQKTELRSLEMQAEISLMDLIDRSLVMVAKRRSDGRVKTCHVHDLLRDMCLAKAREEKFMEQIHAYDELPDPILYQRRLSIFLKRNNEDSSTSLIKYKYLPMLSITPPLYTCLFFNMNKGTQLLGEATNPDFSLLKLLRILHSEGNIIDDDVCDDIVKLVHLRYMSIRAYFKSIPSSISKLSNLETLIIKGVRGEIVVPDTIWKMAKLRHLHINDRATFSTTPMDSSKLENLGTLSTPVIASEKLVSKVPNLRKLKCILICRNDYQYGIIFHELESLDKLESLKVLYYGGVKFTGQFKLPMTLKKLSISKFRLQWSQISIFQTLPNLEVLKLRSGAVEDEFWDIGDDDEFSNLKLLKLENLNIKRWSASSENFPSLEKVVLERCRKLEEIPSSLGEFNTLQKIEVLWCGRSAAKMAKEIQEGQEVSGNDWLKVHIYPPPVV